MADSWRAVMVTFHLLNTQEQKEKIPGFVLLFNVPSLPASAVATSCFPRLPTRRLVCVGTRASLSPRSGGRGGTGQIFDRYQSSGPAEGANRLRPRPRLRLPPTGALVRRPQVIRRPWPARRPRRCRCSTLWGGTPRRGWTPRTSCGER